MKETVSLAWKRKQVAITTFSLIFHRLKILFQIKKEKASMPFFMEEFTVANTFSLIF